MHAFVSSMVKKNFLKGESLRGKQVPNVGSGVGFFYVVALLENNWFQARFIMENVKLTLNLKSCKAHVYLEDTGTNDYLMPNIIGEDIHYLITWH